MHCTLQMHRTTPQTHARTPRRPSPACEHPLHCHRKHHVWVQGARSNHTPHAAGRRAARAGGGSSCPVCKRAARGGAAAGHWRSNRHQWVDTGARGEAACGFRAASGVTARSPHTCTSRGTHIQATQERAFAQGVSSWSTFCILSSARGDRKPALSVSACRPVLNSRCHHAQGWLDAVKQLAEELGPVYGAALFCGVYILFTIFLVPGSILTLAAGAIFGARPALLLVRLRALMCLRGGAWGRACSREGHRQGPRRFPFPPFPTTLTVLNL